MVEEGLRTFLLTDPLIVALIGQRMFPGKRPQRKTPTTSDYGLLPCITYRRVDGPRVRHLRGTSALAHPRIQLDCWAATQAEARQLADTARRSNGGVPGGPALEAFQGWMAGYQIQAGQVVDDFDDVAEAVHGDEGGPHKVSVDVILWFNETRG